MNPTLILALISDLYGPIAAALLRATLPPRDPETVCFVPPAAPMASLLASLAQYGLITDSSTA